MKNYLFKYRYFAASLMLAGLIYALFQLPKAEMQNAPSTIQTKDISQPFPIKRFETPQTWQRDGEAFIERIKNQKEFKKHAKNVILFVGDGMGITTLTASRILQPAREAILCGA